MYVVKYIKYGSDEYQKTLELRNEVMRKPLGRSIWDEDFSCEENQIIIGAFETNTMFSNLLIGVGVLSMEDEKTYMVEYVCVDSALQKKGVGTALMRCMEKIATDRGATKIKLDARVKAIDFYQRMGYMPKGEIFHKEIAPGGHLAMEKELHPVPAAVKELMKKYHQHYHSHGEGHHHHHAGCGHNHEHHHDECSHAHHSKDCGCGHNHGDDCQH